MPPEVLDAVDRNHLGKAVIVIEIFYRSVVHASMAINGVRKTGLAAQVVSSDNAADTDITDQKLLLCGAGLIQDDLCHEIATAFQSAHHDDLDSSAAIVLAALQAAFSNFSSSGDDRSVNECAKLRC